MNSTYKLFGYLNLFPGLSGFLYPVFLKDGLLYLADGNIRYIYSFHPLKTDYVNYIQTFSCSTRNYCIGNHYPHIYQKENGEILFGHDHALYNQLKDYHVENPVLQKELTDFFQEVELLCSSNSFYYGTGRRKEAVARVFLSKGQGNIMVNHTNVNTYFSNMQYIHTIQQPFLLTNTALLFDAYVTVRGGGTSGQANAICHGISRALLEFNSEYRSILKPEGLLTRDPRMKERKKPGLKSARRSPQFCKR